jgi:hypothetical protein
MSASDGRPELLRTYGGSGRHAIPGNGVRVLGSPDDVRKVLRRHGVAPTFDTLDVSPDYVPRHALATLYEFRAVVLYNGPVHVWRVNA